MSTPVSASIRSKLLSVARVLSQPKGTVLFHRNDPASGVFLICKGRVTLDLEVGQHGVALLNRTVAPDSILGLPGTLAQGKYSLTAIAIEDSEVAFVDRASLLELIRTDSNGVGFEIIRLLGEEVVRIRELLASAPVH
ncbi:MAG TPA: cyclic nucleotide-binding domain-containing protein [Terriglobales bacterium]|nr:cyclic nucleotide-binding domain-containing protein [Terriglobales bacterium]